RPAEQDQHAVVLLRSCRRSGADTATTVAADTVAVARRPDRLGAVRAAPRLAGAKRVADAGVHAQRHALQDGLEDRRGVPRRASLDHASARRAFLARRSSVLLSRHGGATIP